MTAPLFGDGTRLAVPVFVAEISNLSIFLWRKRRAKGFHFARNDHDTWPAEPNVIALALEHAKQAVVPATRAVHPDLVESAHLVVHGLPHAAAAELRGRRVGDSFDDSDNFRSHACRA